MNEKKKIPYTGFIYIALALVFLSLPTFNKSLEAKSGQLLVAKPKVEQKNFKESVLFINNYSLLSAHAVMINRPLDNVPSAVPESLKETELPLYYGGPVDFPERIYIVKNMGSTMMVEEVTDLAAVPEMLAAKLENLEKSRKSQNIKVILGYAGWGPLQLLIENMKGYWLFVENDPSRLQDIPMQELWSILVKTEK